MSAPTANQPASGVFSRHPRPHSAKDASHRSVVVVAVAGRPGLRHIPYLCHGARAAEALLLVPQYHYLTPFYSPCMKKACAEASDSGRRLRPNWLFVPYAALTLPFLLLFRLTRDYYRGAYYRTVWQSPTACGVAEPRAHYTGETRFPLIVQNTHRYFFYIAGIISVINSYDAIVAFHSDSGPGGFGFGLGNVILLGNVIMLWVYTLSCAFVPARDGRATQALLQTPCAHTGSGLRSVGSTPGTDVRVDHARHPDAH